MESSKIGSFLEFGEVRVHCASGESSEEGNKSLGQSSHEISVSRGSEVSASRWFSSVEVLKEFGVHGKLKFNSVDDGVHQGLVSQVESFRVGVANCLGLV